MTKAGGCVALAGWPILCFSLGGQKLQIVSEDPCPEMRVEVGVKSMLQLVAAALVASGAPTAYEHCDGCCFFITCLNCSIFPVCPFFMLGMLPGFAKEVGNGACSFGALCVSGVH